MAAPATDRQRELLRAIQGLTDARGFPPTLAELSSRLGMLAPGGAASGVKACVSKGYLTVIPRTSRSMQLTPEGLAEANRNESAQTQPAG